MLKSPESFRSELASRRGQNQAHETSTARRTVRVMPAIPPGASTYELEAAGRTRYEAHHRQISSERYQGVAQEQQHASEAANARLNGSDASDALLGPEAVVSELKITYCNRAYTGPWFKMLQRQSVSYFAILQAILREIGLKDGGDISKADIFRRDPEIERLVNVLGFEIIPSRGQMLRHNGNGIRHAKYAPSKSIAVIWEKIGQTIFVTFDDHAPLQYHRAISHLRDIKLGKTALPKRPRTTGRFFRNLKMYWNIRYSRNLKGINLKRRYYE